MSILQAEYYCAPKLGSSTLLVYYGRIIAQHKKARPNQQKIDLFFGGGGGTFCTFFNGFDKFGFVEFILNHRWCEIDNVDTIVDHFFSDKPKSLVAIFPKRAMVFLLQLPCPAWDNCHQKFWLVKKMSSKMVSKISILHQQWFRMNSTNPNLSNSLKKVQKVASIK